jgi:hypothetical protein
MTPPAPAGTTFEPPTDVIRVAPALERRGRAWLIWSFLLCPCHLPLSLAVLASLFGGTALGTVVRDHAWVAGTLITATWIMGTGYGFHLIRRAQRANGSCPTSPG